MAGGASPLTLPDTIFPYAVTCAFLVFLGISLSWELFIGVTSWLLHKFSHLKQVVVNRLKEELLALGIVSLVLAFITPVLTTVCSAPPPETVITESMKESASKYCPEGTYPLFSSETLAASHYLLFWIAVTQIGYTLLSASFTTLRYGSMLIWEQEARSNIIMLDSCDNHDLDGDDAAATPVSAGTAAKDEFQTDNKYGLGTMPARNSKDAASKAGSVVYTGVKRSMGAARSTARSMWFVLCGGFDSDTYRALRSLLQQRIQCDANSSELRNINLAVASEQLIQKEVSNVHAHTWLQILALSLLTLYPTRAGQVFYANPFCLGVVLFLTVKQAWFMRYAYTLIHNRGLNKDMHQGSFSEAREGTLHQHPATPTDLDALGLKIYGGGGVGAIAGALPAVAEISLAAQAAPADAAAQHAHGADRVDSSHVDERPGVLQASLPISWNTESSWTAAPSLAPGIEHAGHHVARQELAAFGSYIIPSHITHLDSNYASDMESKTASDTTTSTSTSTSTDSVSPVKSGLGPLGLRVDTYARPQGTGVRKLNTIVSGKSTWPAACITTAASMASPTTSTPLQQSSVHGHEYAAGLPVAEDDNQTSGRPLGEGVEQLSRASMYKGVSAAPPAAAAAMNSLSTAQEEVEAHVVGVSQDTNEPTPMITPGVCIILAEENEGVRETLAAPEDQGTLTVHGDVANREERLPSSVDTQDGVVVRVSPFESAGKRAAMFDSLHHDVRSPTNVLYANPSGISVKSKYKNANVRFVTPDSANTHEQQEVHVRSSGSFFQQGRRMLKSLSSKRMALPSFLGWRSTHAPDLERVMTMPPQHAQDAIADVHQQLSRMFWFRWPRLLLWLIELVMVCNASIITYFLFILLDKQSRETGNTGTQLPVVLCLLFWNIAMAMYIGWVIVPQYALLLTAVVVPPSAILHHLKWSKVVGEEESRGVAGLTYEACEVAYEYTKHCMTVTALPITDSSRLGSPNSSIHPRFRADAANYSIATNSMQSIRRQGTDVDTVTGRLSRQSLTTSSLTRKSMGVPRKPVPLARSSMIPQQNAARSRLMDAWVGSLAVRSGVLIAGQQAAAAQAHWNLYAPLFMKIVDVWRRKARAKISGGDANEETYIIQGGVHLRMFWDVFTVLDLDGTRVLTSSELQTHMKDAYNVRLTSSELQAMLFEVAAAGVGASWDRSSYGTLSDAVNTAASNATATSTATTTLSSLARRSIGIARRSMGSTRASPDSPLEGSSPTFAGNADRTLTSQTGNAGPFTDPPPPQQQQQQPEGSVRGGDRFASGQDRAVSGVTATGPKVHKKGVIFQNFVMYAAFAFLDPSKRGYISGRSLSEALLAHGIDPGDDEIAAMIDVAAARTKKVGSVSFLRLMRDVQLEVE